MSEATHGIEELKLEEPLFKHVKFYISGKIRDEQEIFFNILQDNGGKRMNYFSDFVTHCILGEDASESDILCAKEVPAVTQDWVILSEKCKKLLPTKGFSLEDTLLFSGIHACVSQVSKTDIRALWAMITFNGGKLSLRLDRSCTHLIITKPEGLQQQRQVRPVQQMVQQQQQPVVIRGQLPPGLTPQQWLQQQRERQQTVVISQQQHAQLRQQVLVQQQQNPLRQQQQQGAPPQRELLVAPNQAAGATAATTWIPQPAEAAIPGQPPPNSQQQQQQQLQMQLQRQEQLQRLQQMQREAAVAAQKQQQQQIVVGQRLQLQQPAPQPPVPAQYMPQVPVSQALTPAASAQHTVPAPVVQPALEEVATPAEPFQKARQLGCKVTTNKKEATHLVMPKMQRTIKMICRHIVSTQWILDSHSQNRILDEQPYALSDPEFDKMFGCTISKVLEKPNRREFFKDKVFYVTPSIIPAPKALQEVIECAGGTVERHRRPLKQITEMNKTELKYIVITHEKDFHLLGDIISSPVAL